MNPKEGVTFRKVLAVISIIVVAITAVLLLMPGISKVRSDGARPQTINRLKQVALAAHGYNDQFKRLPKAWDVVPIQFPQKTEFYTTPLGQMAPFYENNIDSIINPPDFSFTGIQVKAGSPTKVAVVNNPYTSISANYFIFGDPKEGVFPSSPIDPTKPFGDPLTVSTIKDGSSNTMMFATCFAVCNGVPIKLNDFPGMASSPFLSSANEGEKNWQSAPQPERCEMTAGKHAQSYNGSAIQIALCDGTARNVLGDGLKNAQWNGALRPSDSVIPQWD